MNLLQRFGRPAAIMAGFLCVCQVVRLTANDGVTTIPVDVAEQQSTPMKPFMQAKLTGAQDVLQGLVTRDFERIGDAADALREFSLSAPRVLAHEEFDDEVYAHFRTEFARQASQLEQMADAENLEGAAFVNQNLTATCIACHAYIRDRDRSGDSQTRAHTASQRRSGRVR